MTRLLDIELDPQTRALAGAGDPQAQSRLYLLLSGPVFALVRRLIRDRAAAEDIFQDSLMAVFEHLPQFRGEAAFGVWVRQIVTTRCFMYLRSPWQRARFAFADPGDGEDEARNLPPGADASLDLPLQIDLSRALATLAPRTRAVVWLHDVEGLTHEEIARGFGRTVSYSKSQLARAHQSLKVLLHAPEEPTCSTLTAQLKGVS